ncbi:MAG TPA: hypothetical protein VMS08_05470, partial [Candidatus Saccharimonadia bacterium]|nr:hypothetical protein [Candidatus Saccharimonadia bacterium]
GTTTDATEVTFALPAETAAADTAQITIILTVRSVNAATGTWTGNLQLEHNDNPDTGFIGVAGQDSVDLTSTTGAFNDTTAGAIVGLTVTTGAADVITFQQVQASALGL